MVVAILAKRAPCVWSLTYLTASPYHTPPDALTICHYNDKTIAVATKGDNAAELRSNVSYFKSHPCDIAITAARSRGGTHDVIKAYAQETGAEVVWIYKRAEAGAENAVNLKWAERVVEAISNLSTE